MLPTWRSGPARQVTRWRGYSAARTRTPSACRWQSSGRAGNAVIEQLRRVRELQARVSSENSKSRKEAIIAEYPDLRELLEHVYHPDFRAHLSSDSLKKYLASQPDSTLDARSTPPGSITALLDKLSSREVVGNAAKDLMLSFLKENGILDANVEASTDLETFGRLLDRNLVAGFGARTLSAVQWDNPTPGPAADPTTSVTEDAAVSSDPKGAFGTPSRESATPRSMKAFAVALGKSIDAPFSEITRSLSTCKWYASRKLDGVRVITFLDFLLTDESVELVDVEFRSRTGKPFTSLARVEDHLHRLAEFPRLRAWLERDSRILEDRSSGQVKRLVLDGEICVMRERKGSTATTAARPDDGTGAGAIWADHHLEEDFTSTVSEIRRQAPYTIAHPVYFIFDILDHTAFDTGKGSSTFGQRVDDIRELGRWLVSDAGSGEKVIRPLAQWEVTDPSEIEEMVARAAEEGWEGLVLRADKPYKGSRSTDIRKFKQWLDAEYTVVGTDNSRMRLSLDGVFGEYDAMANIWIEHKEVRVSVGSGFTAEQRIRFGQSPDEIIGKEVTVEYFSESASAGREGMSLRFPRVKQIWDEGKRTI